MNELKPCRFDECQPGIFEFRGNLFLKSEYGDEAYCLESGELFWGGAHNAQDRAVLTVIPIDYDVLLEVWNRRAQPTNEPLTLERLREMDGEPVWIKDGIGEGWFVTGAIVGTKLYFYEKSITVGEPLSGCGKTWLAYRRKPEPEGKIEK